MKKRGMRNADHCGEAAEVSRWRTMCTAYELGKRGGTFPERVHAAAVKELLRIGGTRLIRGKAGSGERGGEEVPSEQ